MLDFKVTLKQINWESGIDFAFPVILAKINNSEKQNIAFRFMRANGEAVKPVLKKALKKLDEREKTAFAEWGVCAFEREILSLVNNILLRRRLLESVSVGNIRAYSGVNVGELEIRITGLEIDYSNDGIRMLLHDKLSVSLPAGLAGIIGRGAETAVLKLTSAKPVSAKICQIAESKLRDFGIAASVASCEITKGADIKPTDAPKTRALPERLEKCAFRIASEMLSELGN